MIEKLRQQVGTLLDGTRFERMASTATSFVLDGQAVPGLYSISDGFDEYFVKVRNSSQIQIADSVSTLRGVNDSQRFINPIEEFLVRDDLLITITPRINGDRIDPAYRHELPEVFRRLARFNRENPSDGPFTSMYLDRRQFETVDELVRAELTTHFDTFKYGSRKNWIEDAARHLRDGFPCVCCEDTNLGNFLRTTSGDFVVVDTEWTHPGLNLHQFDHFDLFGFEKPAWYRVVTEASDCYRAYFRELDVEDRQADRMVLAIETLSVMRSVTYAVLQGRGEEATEIARRLDVVAGVRARSRGI